MTTPRKMPDEKQTWMFQTEEQRDKAKDQLAYRHPGNLTEWVDPFTVALYGQVHKQTQTVLKQLRAKRID